MSTTSPPADATRTLELRVPGMDCASCAEKLTASVGSLEGVTDIDPRVASGVLVIEYDPESADEAAVRERVRAVGYEVEACESGPELTFAVPEMDCSSCAGKVERSLESVSEVTDYETQPATGRVTVTPADAGDADRAAAAVVDAVADAGYDATPMEDRGEPDAEPIWRSRRAVSTAIGAVLVGVGMLFQFALPSADTMLFTVAGGAFAVSGVLYVASAAVAGAPVLRNGYYSARTRNLDIDVLMSAGIVASVLTAHPFEGAMLAVLFSVAELLERFSMDRARNSVRELVELSPETATVRRAGEERTVPVEDLAVGETVVVRPGESIPTDGVVREGESPVNQAPITGESVPVDVAPGDEVYGGTILESGYLEVEVTSEAGESTISRIVDLVADAEREKTERERFVDRFASVYTPIVVLAAIAVAALPPLATGAAWDTWFLRGLTVLVIACPCAFVISTPVSVVSGVTSAARNGVLIKGGRHLEAVGESDTLAVDKTGTLTTGDLSVTDVIALEGAEEADLLGRAGAIERRSEHPVGAAIVAEAEERGLDLEGGDVDDFEALTGRGVRAAVEGETHYVGKPDLFGDLAVDLSHVHATDGGQVLETTAKCDYGDCLDVLQDVVPRLESEGKTVVIVGTDERVLGVIAVADEVRPEARWAVSRLHEQGIRVVMLTGDNEGTARAIAEDVGVAEFHAELLPEEKLEAIRRLERESEAGRVAMVGDGINDAPALATADVGIAMGAAGTDTALETADVALMGDDLARLPYLFRLSRAANGVIRQNIVSSLAVKAVLVAGAPIGLVTVIHAVVIGDMGMSLGVTGNAMRLSRVEPETPDADE